MAMKRCNNGHFYDPEKYTTCPYCGVEIDIGATRPVGASPAAAADQAPTVPLARTQPIAADADATKPVQPVKKPVAAPRTPPADPHATVGILQKEKGIDPIVGWLVCTEGPDRGQDYRVRSGRNFMGRAPAMHIAIRGDTSISREKHAILSYDPRTNDFTLLPGEATEHVYLNGEAVHVPTDLGAYDTIELGDTKLVFVPFCSSRFQW